MQSLAKIATEIEPEKNLSQTTLGERLNISNWEARRAALAEIFYIDRASAQYDGREPEDLDALVQIVIPQTRSIPVNYLAECYVVALEQRQPGDNFQIRGVELVNAWKVIQGRVEMESKGAYENKTRLLPSRARAACSRCFGTGFERMPDGSVRPGCPHDEWTPDDELELERGEEQRRADAARQAEIMREALKAVAAPKAPVREVPPAPPGYWLKCDSCGRRQDFTRKSDGDRCGKLLDAHVDPKLCEGVMRTETPAEGSTPAAGAVD